jgi:hypothetical protein
MGAESSCCLPILQTSHPTAAPQGQGTRPRVSTLGAHPGPHRPPPTLLPSAPPLPLPAPPRRTQRSATITPCRSATPLAQRTTSLYRPTMNRLGTVTIEGREPVPVRFSIASNGTGRIAPRPPASFDVIVQLLNSDEPALLQEIGKPWRARIHVFGFSIPSALNPHMGAPIKIVEVLSETNTPPADSGRPPL